MTMLDLEMNALDIARSVAGLGVNWLIQSSLLIIAGLWLGTALRSKGSAAQSAVYRTTLAAVLLCPLVSWGLARFGATGWSLEMPAAYTQDEVFFPSPQDADTGPAVELEPVVATDTDLPSFETLANTARFESSTPNEFSDNEPPVDLAPPTDTEEKVAEVASAVHAPTATVSTNWFGISAIVVGALWLLTGGWLLARLAHSWHQLIRIRRSAAAADPATIETCRNVAELFRVDPPTVLLSPFLPSPCLAGLHRPAVLLPDDELSLPMRDVLIHELAHLARGDCYWNLLRRIGTSLLFFQPLMWLLSRRLDSTAEEVCDDYVVQFGGDRREYAHRLVDIAELSVAPIAAAGVGIVSLRSMLAARVARIMDTSRSLSTRVGHALLTLVLLAGLVGTILVGLVGVEPDRAAAEANTDAEAQPDESDQPSEIEPAADSTSDDEATATGAITGAIQSVNSDASLEPANDDDTQPLTKVHGRVVDEADQPVPGALIRVMRKTLSLKNEHELLDEQRAGDNGLFEVTMPGVDGVPQWMYRRDPQTTTYLTSIVVTAPGYAAAWAGRTQQLQNLNDEGKTGELVLRLSKQPSTIRGQIVNLEGQPVAGASVQVTAIATSEPGAVDQWLATVERLRIAGELPKPSSMADYAVWASAMVMDRNSTVPKKTDDPYFPQKYQVGMGHPEFPAAVTTGDDGRFEIAGVAPDQLVGLSISGPGIVAHSIIAVTREMDALDLPHTSVANNIANGYYGATFAHPAAPGVAIAVKLKDAESDEPLAGMGISVVPVLNNVWTHNPAWHGVTDDYGQIRIEGLPTDTQILLSVDPSQGAAYLAVEHLEIPKGNALETTEVEIKFHRGVFVRGKVTDAETGQPVDATLHYHPYIANENAKNFQRYQTDSLHVDLNNRRYSTGKDGTFEAVVIPGRGILGVHATDRGGFCIGLGAEAIAGLDQSRRFPTHDYCSPSLYHRLLEIDVPADADEVHHDLTVSSGATVKYLVTDDQSQPLRGIVATGSTAFGGAHTSESKDASIEVKALRPDEKRRVAFLHRERRLGRIIEVAAPQNALSNAEPQSVSLLPCGSVTGKLINAEGEPIIKASISAHTLPLRDVNSLTPQHTFSDDNGEFRLEYLPVGAAYQVSGNGRDVRFFELAKELRFEPGETIDLGTIDVTKMERPEPKRTSAAVPASQTPDESPLVIKGRVESPDGRPLAGATVIADWVFVGGHWPRPRSEPSQNFEHSIVAQTTSDDVGNFEITVSKNSPRDGRLSHSWHIVAYADGYGPAWKRDVHLRKDSSPTLRLSRDQPVRGRIIDLEGKPIAGVQVRIRELRPSNGEEAVANWIKESQEKMPPKAMDAYFFGSSNQYAGAFPTTWDDGGLALRSPALPADTKTDNDGRFSFKNLGENRLALIEVDSSSIAKSYLAVVTRDMEAISGRPLNMIGIRADTHFGREFEFVAEPTQPIVGTVTDADTGKPLENVNVRLGQFAGNLFSQGDFLATRTDERGKYELIGAPQGGGHRLDFEPAVDQPYFPTPKTLPVAPGSFDPIVCDIALKRGQWIVGKVTDAASHEAVVDATVHYLPLRSNEQVPKYANYDPRITGSAPRDRYRSAKDGGFRVLAIPGAGILAAIAQGEDSHSYSSLSVDEVPKHLVGDNGNVNAFHPWTITGYHALREVEILESVDDVPYSLEFKRGLTHQLKLVDTNGRPVRGSRVLGRVFPPQLEQPLEDSAVEVIGLRSNDKRIVAIVHPVRRIGSALEIAAGETTTISLEPCAIARGRVVDEDGQPISGVDVGVHIDGSDNWGRSLISATTDADGQFEVLLPPGRLYRVAHYSQNGPNVSAECMAATGVVFELGNMVHGTKLTVEQTAKMTESLERKRTAARATSSANATNAVSQSIASAVEAARNDDTAIVNSDHVVTIRGKVLDDGGQPVAGANVRLLDDEATEAQTATSGLDGRFAIEFDKARFTKPDWHREAWRFARLLVTADGFAPAWLEGKDLIADKELAVQLKRDDVPIRGQVLTLEGQPVPNARLVIWDVHQPNSGSLDGMFESLRESPLSMQLQTYRNTEMSWFRGRSLELKVTRGTLTRTADGSIVTADAEGRFEFTGIGPERLARGRIEGENIQSVEVSIATRSKVDDWWKRESLGGDARMRLESGDRLPQIYPSSFEHFASPSSLITGVVLDRATGQPLAGIGVSGGIRGGGDHASGVTDENGRYELTGLAVDGTLRLFVGSNDAAQLPYIGVEREIEIAAGASPKPEDTRFTLTRGIVVRGTVTDAKTGGAVKSRVEYIAHGSNPRVAEIGDRIYPYGGSLTNDKSEFAVVALPGRGALGATTNLAAGVSDHYRPVQAEDFGLPLTDEGWINTANHGIIMPIHYTAAVFLDLKPDEESRVVPLVVKPIFEVARVQCIDSQGQPLKKVGVIGQFPWNGKSRVFPDSGKEVGPDSAKYIQIAGLDEEGRQPAIFMHRGTNSAAILFGSKSAQQPRLADLQKLENGLHQLTLKPVAIVTGKVVDDKGAAVDRASVELRLITNASPTDPTVEVVRHYTNGIGRFKMEFVPAGGPYLLTISGNDTPGGIVKRDIMLEPEQFLNLDRIDITKLASPESKQAAEKTAAPDTAAMNLHGRVIGPDVEPAAGAHIAVIGASNRQRRGGDLDYRDEVLAETTTNADGTYQLSLTGISSKTHTRTVVVARTDGAAMSWQNLDPDSRTIDVSFELVSEEPIRGQLVDIEGQPAAGVRMSIAAVMPTSKDEKYTNGVGFRDFSASPAAWPKTITTDDDGRFVIHGIPASHGVFINVAGSDRFAPQHISLNSGMPEQRGERDGTYRALVKNLKPGEEAVLALAPAQIFEGVVRYEDTNQPAPHARLTIWASQQKFGSMISVPGKADAHGRYRISPNPGIRFGVTAYPPDGTPYLTRELPAVDWDDAAKVKKVDVTLPRGVLVRGKVVEAMSGAPVAGATIQYVPEDANNPHNADDILTGWQGIQLSNERGEFEIVVLPGPGNLLVHGPQGEFVLRETSDRQLSRGRPGGQRNYANAIERVNPADGAEPVDVTIRLQRGAKVTGQLVNEAGEPVDEAILISQLNIVPTTLSWRGDASKQVLGGSFELSPLEPNQKYTVYFLDAKRRLGATATLTTEDVAPTVVLKPCGQATARFVDAAGQPLADFRSSLHMAVSPGASEYDFKAAERGELAADADFVSNIDRTNHWHLPPADKDGRITFPALIPGAIYRITRSEIGDSKEFSVESGQSLDLGQIVIDREQ